MAYAIARIDQLSLAVNHPENIGLLLGARLDTLTASNTQRGVDCGMERDGLVEPRTLRLQVRIAAF